MILISFTEGYHLDLSLQLSSHTIYFLHLATYHVHINSATTQSLGIIGLFYMGFVYKFIVSSPKTFQMTLHIGCG